MKFNCDRRAEARRKAWIAKREAQKRWHPYFTWLPTRVGYDDCRWLEWIERKRSFEQGYVYASSYWYWEYRAKK